MGSSAAQALFLLLKGTADFFPVSFRSTLALSAPLLPRLMVTVAPCCLVCSCGFCGPPMVFWASLWLWSGCLLSFRALCGHVPSLPAPISAHSGPFLPLEVYFIPLGHFRGSCGPPVASRGGFWFFLFSGAHICLSPGLYSSGW